jgi:hypothetical protein
MKNVNMVEIKYWNVLDVLCASPCLTLLESTEDESSLNKSNI